MLKMTKEICMKALYGGLFLGGGGGGALEDGIKALEEAMKYTDAITVMEIDEIDGENIIINASMVGAPSAPDRYVNATHWKTALKNFQDNYPKKISGIISNENGGMATANGWLLSAVTGIPIIDAPCNGRAQPTSTMGSMSLSTMPTYTTLQSACGGKDERYIEVVTKGGLAVTAKIVRQTPVVNGGMSAVLRNPVTANYVKKHSAVGGLNHAIEVGEIIMGNLGNCEKILDLLKEKMKANVICTGPVSEYVLDMDGGYDVGMVRVKENDRDYEATFWNEYMTLERDGERLATFPDIIATLDARTGLPLPTAELSEGRSVVIVKVPKAELKLGSGMYIKELFEEAEKAVHREMVKYMF